MPITHVQLVSLPVLDHDRARDFYVDVLRSDLVRDNPDGNGIVLHATAPGA